MPARRAAAAHVLGLKDGPPTSLGSSITWVHPSGMSSQTSGVRPVLTGQSQIHTPAQGCKRELSSQGSECEERHTALSMQGCPPGRELGSAPYLYSARWLRWCICNHASCCATGCMATRAGGGAAGGVPHVLARAGPGHQLPPGAPHRRPVPRPRARCARGAVEAPTTSYPSFLANACSIEPCSLQHGGPPLHRLVLELFSANCVFIMRYRRTSLRDMRSLFPERLSV